MANVSTQVVMRLNAGGLSLALKRARDAGGKLPSYLANKACHYIADRAARDMPRVLPATMDRELEVQVKGVTAKGNLSRAKKPRLISVVAHENSLASRIILASFYGNSPFNIRTGQVFRRMKPDTHGSAAFWQWVTDKASQMTKARHSSGGFFAACAKAVNVGFAMALGRMAPAGVRNQIVAGPQQPGFDINKSSKLLNKGLAQVFPATGESGLARFTVATTEPDTKGSPGGALERRIAPVWQRAVEAETQSILKHAQETYANQLRRAGFVVR